MITILIADKYPIFRLGLHAVISTIPKDIVVMEANSEKDTCVKILQYKPDIVFIDASIVKDFKVAQVVNKQSRKIRFAILATQDSVRYIEKFLDIEINAFLSKETPIEELKNCIYSLIKGDKFIDGSFKKSFDKTISIIDSLTKKEVQVLKKMIEKKTNSQMADEFGCSEKNIERFKTNIRKKLNISSSYGGLLSWTLQNESLIKDFLK